MLVRSSVSAWPWASARKACALAGRLKLWTNSSLELAASASSSARAYWLRSEAAAIARAGGRQRRVGGPRER
eukprot:scaffold42448_cov30-Tisochrysis_lutea.AAC.1